MERKGIYAFYVQRYFRIQNWSLLNSTNNLIEYIYGGIKAENNKEALQGKRFGRQEILPKLGFVPIGKPLLEASYITLPIRSAKRGKNFIQSLKS